VCKGWNKPAEVAVRVIFIVNNYHKATQETPTTVQQKPQSQNQVNKPKCCLKLVPQIDKIQH